MKLLLCVAACTCSMMTVSAQAAPVLNFFIDGNTFTEGFSITNLSDNGELVTGFQLDIDLTNTCFDTVSAAGDGVSPCENTSNIGVPFTSTGGTDLITGLLGPSLVTDGSTLLDLSFSDFDSGETFSWDIDVDFDNGTSTVLGSDLIGASAIVDFSDGQRLLGTLVAVDGNSDASEFIVTGLTTIPSVPVPAAAWLFGSGLLGLVGLARRKA